VLAATVRVTRDLATAEESVQDAYVAALAAWARDGVPERPGAWLTTVARRNALNAMARHQTLQAKLPLLVEPEVTEMADRSRNTGLHVLPPGAVPRGAGGADAAPGVRGGHGGHRPRVPGQ
jgi:RNA polymerase sigma-70 factor (ECF subfamily)